MVSKVALDKVPNLLGDLVANLQGRSRGRFHSENEEVEEEDEQPTPVSENNTRSCHPGELDMNGIRFSARYCPPLNEELQWIVTSISGRACLYVRLRTYISVVTDIQWGEEKRPLMNKVHCFPKVAANVPLVVEVL